ncbi:MAG: hypothetical protein ABH813_03530 [Patescibacteria group bacterium]
MENKVYKNYFAILKKILPKNTSNKIVSLVIIILILAVGFLIWYCGSSGSLEKGELQGLTIKAGRPGDLRLVKFPKDAINPIEAEGIPATDFLKDDIMGIEGSLNIQGVETLTFRILERAGGEIQKEKLEILRQGDKIRACCIDPPEKPGEYVLEFFFASEKIPIFPLLFKVSP